jgi:hypothetical protein
MNDYITMKIWWYHVVPMGPYFQTIPFCPFLNTSKFFPNVGTGRGWRFRGRSWWNPWVHKLLGSSGSVDPVVFLHVSRLSWLVEVRAATKLKPQELSNASWIDIWDSALILMDSALIALTDMKACQMKMEVHNGMIGISAYFCRCHEHLWFCDQAAWSFATLRVPDGEALPICCQGSIMICDLQVVSPKTILDGDGDDYYDDDCYYYCYFHYYHYHDHYHYPPVNYCNIDPGR